MDDQKKWGGARWITKKMCGRGVEMRVRRPRETAPTPSACFWHLPLLSLCTLIPKPLWGPLFCIRNQAIDTNNTIYGISFWSLNNLLYIFFIVYYNIYKILCYSFYTLYLNSIEKNVITFMSKMDGLNKSQGICSRSENVVENLLPQPWEICNSSSSSSSSSRKYLYKMYYLAVVVVVVYNLLAHPGEIPGKIWPVLICYKTIFIVVFQGNCSSTNVPDLNFGNKDKLVLSYEATPYRTDWWCLFLAVKTALYLGWSRTHWLTHWLTE